jgi:hypothetical protein
MKLLLYAIIIAINSPVEALASTAVDILKDHSGAAMGLFNNMRTPAALIGGALVPLGILSAPRVEKGDTKAVALMKKANVILGVTSLLSEILAVTYSSIAINKLAEVESPLTRGCAELIAKNYELAWVGTNVHFLMGLMGFGLIVGSKAYISNSPRIGRVTIGWAIAAFLHALSIVNRGIAMGHNLGADTSAKFASNFGSLIWRYLKLVVGNSKGGVLAVGAVLIASYSIVESARVLLSEKDQ